MTALRLNILGPLRIRRDALDVDAGPRQQAQLLALLLVRVGRPVSVTELIELIWAEDAPATAANVIQKYVGAVRRLLEPDLPTRSAGSYVHRQGDGYRFVADRGTLDLVEFRELVAEAETALADHLPEAAFESYVDALTLWRGPVGDDFPHGSTARPIFAALDEEFLDACVAAAGLATTVEQAGRVLRPLRLAAAIAPLREPVQAALRSALAAAGEGSPPTAVHDAVHGRAAPDGVVGRIEELAVLRQAVDSALGDGTGLIFVEGEPGGGKTRLLEEAAALADRSGALVVWGHCLEGNGTPSMWPWVEAVGTILDGLPDARREEWLAGELGRLIEPRGGAVGSLMNPDSGGQFRLFEMVVDVVGQIAAQRPVVLLVDDLQWADAASLKLFGHVASRLPAGVALVGALRTHAPTPGAELTRTLAAASRMPGHRRVRLRPLEPDEVTELVRRETGRIPAFDVTRSIHRRTAGNPFFVRELSRLLAEDESLGQDLVARIGVPSTVRDVVRDRMAGLTEETRDVLQLAALIGRDIDLDLLARAVGLDVESILDRLEPAEALGLLGPTPDDPFSYRFAHDLVREAVSGTTPPLRAHRLHLLVADAVEHSSALGASGAERLAHHLWAAGPLADPARTAAALLRAGSRAAAKSAFEAAEQQFWSAARLARTAGLPELELSALSQLITVVGMRSMYGVSALDRLERAEQLARELGRGAEATDFLFTRWVVHAQGLQLERSDRLAHRLREQGEASSDPVVRAYGTHAWGIQQWSVGNVGEGFRCLSRLNRSMPGGLSSRGGNPLRYDLQLLSVAMLGETTALHGDVDGARALHDRLEAAAGDDRYAITVWATMSARTASIVGDPAWALRAAERGIAVDPEFSFIFLGTYQRLVRWWARAMTGVDPEGAAAEVRALLAANLLDPPLSCIATWYGLLAEMRLAAGALDEAAESLDRADRALDAYGQRYPEGLILLLRAQLRHARGEPVAAVRAAAERARALSVAREAHLFAQRAERLLNELDASRRP